MNDLSNEDLGAQYLEAKVKAKEAAEAVKTLEKELDDRLGDGDEITVNGTLHRWTVSVGKSVSYKKVLDWLHSKVQPDVQVLIEEGQEMTDHVGSRTTKSLKPVVE